MRAALVLLAAVASLVAAAPAMAHVSVLPASVAQGEAVELTVRVPTERDIPTTQVRIDFPSLVTVYAFADPPPGWTLRPLRAPDGRFRGVVYSGGSIGAGRYADFEMLGTAFEEGTAVWPVRQRYADGQVKPWTGPPEEPGQPASPESGPTDPGPAAAVQVLSPGSAPSGGAAVAASDDEDGSGAAIWLGVIAIAISALAALGVGLLWSTRPARLPEDSEKT